MASPISDEVIVEPPRKRQKLSPTQPSVTANNETIIQQTGNQAAIMDSTITQIVVGDNGFQPEREAQVGILHFVNSSNPGFSGTLKQRYTDFLVNEIAPDGTVVHLTSDRVPVFKDVTKGDRSKASKPSRITSDASTLSTIETNAEGGLSTEIKPENSEPLQVKSEDDFAPAAAKNKAQDNSSSLDAVADIRTDDRSLTISTEGSINDTKISSFVINPEDHQLLIKYFGTTLNTELVAFHEKILSKPGAKPAVFGSLLSEPITDRPLRGRLHHDVRRIFESRIETESIEDGKIKITAAPPIKTHPEGYTRAENNRQRNPRNQTKGKLGWQELGGQFLHFSLYKENKDTMEVIMYLCRSLKIKPKDFAFAGTKDRRAVTVQRVSVWRQQASSLGKLNYSLRNARIGDFKYEKHGLELGELEGNQFVITLRDCHFGDDAEFDDAVRMQLGNKVVGQAVEHLQAHGFINYFGLQRFGTFGIGTDEVGKKILQNDFEGAVWAILSYSDQSLEASMNPNNINSHDKIGRDDIDRASAIHKFKTSSKAHLALEVLPRKFSAESNIIRHLGSGQNRTDYAGALLCVNRNLRTMYVHAYQSLVWNMAASERWARYGDRVIKGDLVFVDGPAEKAFEIKDEVDENGEIVVHPAIDDVAVSHDDIFQRARHLTGEEAESGKYTIFDIVLPTPGFDIEYPDNDIGDFYKEFMGSERGGRLDPSDMRRKIKDFSLSGSYRKVLAEVGKDLSFEIKTYREDNEQLVETDVEKLDKSRLKYQSSSNSQIGRDGRGPRKIENAQNKNGLQKNRGERQNNNQGWRQNNNYNNKSNGNQFDNNSNQKSAQDHPDAALNSKLKAWINLPAQLAAEDEAYAADYEARKFIRKNPDDIKQPIYKDTFIETSAENEGRRTGYRSTKIIGADNAAHDADKEYGSNVPGAPAPRIQAEGDTLYVDAKSSTPGTSINNPEPILNKTTREEHANVSFASTNSLEDSQDGGVKLPIQGSPNKKSTENISTSPDVDIPDATASTAENASVESCKVTKIGDTLTDQAVRPDSHVVEGPKPAKIALIIKFALGTSQYATMALRELMKAGGVKTYKPDFSMGR